MHFSPREMFIIQCCCRGYGRVPDKEAGGVEITGPLTHPLVCDTHNGHARSGRINIKNIFSKIHAYFKDEKDINSLHGVNIYSTNIREILLNSRFLKFGV